MVEKKEAGEDAPGEQEDSECGQFAGIPDPMCVTGNVTHTLKGVGYGGSEDGTGRGVPIIAVSGIRDPGPAPASGFEDLASGMMYEHCNSVRTSNTTIPSAGVFLDVTPTLDTKVPPNIAIAHAVSGAAGSQKSKPTPENPFCMTVDMGAGKSYVSVTNELAPTLATTHQGEPAVNYSRFIEEPVVFPLDTMNMRAEHPSGGLGFGKCGDPAFKVNAGSPQAAAVIGFDTHNASLTGDLAATLSTNGGVGGGGPALLVQEIVEGVDLYNGSLTGNLAEPLGTLGSSSTGTGPTVLVEQVGFRRLGFGHYVGDEDSSPTKARDYKDATDLVIETVSPDTTFAIQAGALRTNQNSGPDGVGVHQDLAYTLEARSEVQAVAFAQNSRNEVRLEGGDGQRTGAPRTGGSKPGQGKPAVAVSATVAGPPGSLPQTTMRVRRLTPVECERLQGFPDNYTQIPRGGKPAELCQDGPRYKAIGNSWPVPVVHWIGSRIQKALSVTEG